MDDPIRLTALATQISNLSQHTATMMSELGDLKKETLILRVQVHSLRGSLKAAQWIISLILVLLVLAIGSVAYAGKSIARDIIRDVLQAESRSQINVTQYGFLSTKTKILDNPLTFEWTLKQPISLSRLVSIVAEPSAFLPSMTIEAKCVKEGKACQIIVLGNNSKFLELLENGVQCKITLTLKTD